MSILKPLALVALVAWAAFVAANYAYFRGFDDGADTSICLMAHQIDGPKAAMQSRACRNIKGKSLPPRLFPEQAA